MKDKNGVEIKKGDSVIVDEPKEDYSDMHNHSFGGYVKDFHDKYVTVVDGDGDCFDIEPERLEIGE